MSDEQCDERSIGTLTVNLNADTSEFETQIARCIKQMEKLLELIQKVNDERLHL